ncbi:stage V sporulation protein E [Kyrpidia spormannii]|uniref:Factor for spore cortex peptidoglycan synthesis (Stage V sporulation) n=1 Tax=Kyrpidia spormannii TaxID=2055160 RepID=A0A6F9E8T3_9BACL|nr:stage V sporulation protein E [Kyrpidia spormannii]CAB3392707.1 factor for spore cortex peptidoglycan synthesis (stage V sporulation) [Kyrpidia spormannii]
MPDRDRAPDLLLLTVTLLLLGLGVVMVYSASAVLADQRYGDPFYYAKRQLMWAALGVVMMFVMMRLDYRRLRPLAKPVLWLCLLMLVIVLTPIGAVRGGARAWLGVGTLGIQPSEFAKLGFILFFADWLARPAAKIESFWRGLAPALGLVAVAVGLIMLEPDLGQTVVLVGTMGVLIFVAGARVRHLVALGMSAVPVFAALVAVAPYRLGRVVAFLDPWKYPLTEGYHIIQSLYALGPGGLFGLGLGRSRQKFLYLPEPQTDFIFAILAEELGFIGAATVLLLFAALVWRGIYVAMRAPDGFGSLLATGIVAMIGVQVLINVGVVTGSMPVTGITLPLISYGGSSLVLMLTGIGILLNISRHAVRS